MNEINARSRELQMEFVASGQLQDDGMVIFSQSGNPPIENQEFELYLIKNQLESGGAAPEDADRFVSDLKKNRVAKIRWTIPSMIFSGS